MSRLAILFAFGIILGSVRAADDKAATVFTIQDHRGQPTLHIDGRPAYPFMYLPHGGDHQKQYRQFASTGGHFYAFGCPIGNGHPGKFDAAAVDRVFESVLKADPQGYLLPRVTVTAPGWWLEANPDHRVLFDNGETGPQSFASQKWRREIGDQLEVFVRHVRSQPYGRRVIGFHLCSGVTAEWQSWGLWNNLRGDFSPVARQAWHQWLHQYYATDEALRRAWGREDVTRDTASIPSRERREEVTSRFLRRPDEYRDVMDFYRFYPELVADSIVELAGRCKTASEGTTLTGFFYGYAAQYGGMAQESQHLALSTVLACPNVDFLCSPAMYSERGPAGTSTFMSATGSVNLHGKYWFHEADHRTHLVKPDSPFAKVYPAKDLAETRGVLQREFGHCIQRAAGIWWFDMGGGWYDDPAILADFTEMNRLAEPVLLHEPNLLPSPQIAVVHGYHDYARQQPNHGYLVEFVCKQIVSLSRIGTPSEVFLLDDLGRIPASKVYLFINCADLTDTDRANIKALKRNGNILVFTYAAGLGRIDANMDVSEDIAAMSELLGIKMEITEEPLRPKVRLLEQHPLRNEPNFPERFGYDTASSPSFHCIEPDVQVIARYDDLDRPAIVMKTFADHTVVWSAATIPPALLRGLARRAGVHIYSDGDDALFAGHNIITLHAANPGAKTIVLPNDGLATALFGAPAPQQTGRTLRFEMQQAGTRVFHIHPR